MRILAPKLNEMLGQTCIVENRAGAGLVRNKDKLPNVATQFNTFQHVSIRMLIRMKLESGQRTLK